MKDVLPSFTAKALRTLAAPAGSKPLKLLPEHFRNSTVGVSGGETCQKVKSDPPGKQLCGLCIDCFLQLAHLHAAISLLEDLSSQNWGSEEQLAFPTHPGRGLSGGSGGNLLFLSYNYSKCSLFFYFRWIYSLLNNEKYPVAFKMTCN